MNRHSNLAALFLALAAVMPGCGDDDDGFGGTQAQRRGVGAACAEDTDCSEPGQRCLAFKGGYCGLEGCQRNADCPGGSACVAHDDGKTYCFLICVDKPECNFFRPPDVEANCSSKVDLVEPAGGGKTCVPPS